jgi:spore maturation protein CgeB
MKVLCVFGEHNYGTPKRGEGYEYVNFIPALRRLGHEVIFFDSWNKSLHQNFIELNHALLQTVELHRPDVILSVAMHYEIWLETWEILRDSGIAAMVNWTTDDSWKYPKFSRFVAPSFHAFTTTYPKIYQRYKQDGIPHVVLTQWAANAATLQPPLPAAECKYPISFVGTAHGNRPEIINQLQKRGIEVSCFGHGWPHGTVASSDIPQIVRNSIISLNLSNSALVWNGIFPKKENQIKARVFEVPGLGGFLLSEGADGIERHYQPQKEIAIFHNLDELAELANYYLKHPEERDQVAWAGYNRTVNEHTYDLRLDEVIKFASQMRDEYFQKKNISPDRRIDWVKFERMAKEHTMNWRLNLLKESLAKTCSCVFGSVRGPRAARRLVFELSWRLSGSHTYSAKGLPGRMFYSAS